MEKWKKLSSEIVFEFEKFNLTKYAFELPDQKIVDDYYVVEENDVGSVVAVTPANELVLVRQYKHGINEICLELPAGLFDDPQGDPVAESRRELVEETGYEAETYQYLGSFAQNPTRMSNRVHVVLGLQARKTSSQHLDANEVIEVLRVPLDQVRALIRSGEIHALGTVAGILLALDYLDARRGE